MIRLIHALALWFAASLPAVAQDCRGDDLRAELLPDERASAEARLAATPYPEGNHWIARKDGEVLHVIGTMHISDQRLEGPTELLSPVVETAAMLLLEMTASDAAALEASIARDPSIFMMTDASLPDLLSEDDWARLSAAMQARGMPAFIGARMQPWYVSMLLAVPACLKDLLETKDGLDFRLQEVADAHAVPTRSLEPWDTGFRLFNEIPREMQIAMIRSALAPPEVNENLFETLLSAYFEEAHAQSQIVLEVVSPRLTPLSAEETEDVFAAMDTVMIAERNQNWIPVILNALDETDGHVVAAFGAAHLSGTDGILYLLETEGFTLERAPF